MNNIIIIWSMFCAIAWIATCLYFYLLGWLRGNAAGVRWANTMWLT